MGVAWKLAINYLKSNRKRVFLVSSCILISTILITTILLLIESYRECMIASARNDENWEVGYNGITYEEACTIEKHNNVKEISIIRDMGEGVINEEYTITVGMIGYDKNGFNNFVKNKLEEGRLPENSSEVLCNIDNRLYEIGDTITQILEDGTKRECTVVGKVGGYGMQYYEPDKFITVIDRSELQSTDIVNITILSNNLKQIYNDYFDIYYMLKANRDSTVNVDNMAKFNTTLLEYANVVDYTSDFQKNVYSLEGIIIGVIVISSAIFIYSVINISVVERQRYFGILKSIGATTKQMKRSIRVELLIILLITIPFGVVIGIWLDWALITIINNLLPEFAISQDIIRLLFDTNEEMKVAIPMSTIGMAILIIIATVYISSIFPIKKVTRLSAINLIKHNKERTRVKKNKKERKFKASKNIEAKLAFKNVERYKARYSAIVMSLIVSIALIIISNYYINSITEKEYVSGYNYRITGNYNETIHGDLQEEIIDRVQESKISKNAIAYREDYNYLLVDEENISEQEKEFSREIYEGDTEYYAHFSGIFATDEYDSYLDTYYVSLPIISLNDDAYNEYLKEIGLADLKDDEVILVDFVHEKTRYYKGIRLTNYEVGNEITLQSEGPSRRNLDPSLVKVQEDISRENPDVANTAKMKIGAITDKIPNDLPELQIGPLIVVSKEGELNIEAQLFNTPEGYFSYERYTQIALNVSDIAEADAFVESLRQEYNLNADFSKRYHLVGQEHETQEDIDSGELLRDIFIYGFIGIITLIGLINMFNAINTTLDVRKREIVSLITIGMEQKQINKMLFIENAISGLLSLLLGITIGISISYLIYRNNIEYIIYNFEIPWLAIIISAIGITLVITIATIYLKKKLFATDLIETLRKEEV